MTIVKDLVTGAEAVVNFVETEVTDAEKDIAAFIVKATAIFQKIEPDLAAIKAEAIALYNAAKAAEPVVQATINALAVLIADLTAAGV